MTDDKCPLNWERMEEFILARQRVGVVTLSAELLRDFVREAADEAHKLGFKQGREAQARLHATKVYPAG